MRWFLSLCLVLCLVSFCQAVPMNGVIANERIVRLPEDGSKWYISVFGDNDARYKEVVSWFDSGKLKELKDQVHFNPVSKDSPLYERYAPSIKGLPLVRIQDASGAVVGEIAGNKLPASGEALYNAIADAVNGTEHWLPWRKHKADPDPKPDPSPDPNHDPIPQPIDSGGPPVIEPVEDDVTPVLVCMALLVIGFGYSVVRKLKAGKPN